MNLSSTYLPNPPDLIRTELQKDWKLVEKKRYTCKWSGMMLMVTVWDEKCMGMGIETLYRVVWEWEK